MHAVSLCNVCHVTLLGGSVTDYIVNGQAVLTFTSFQTIGGKNVPTASTNAIPQRCMWTVDFGCNGGVLQQCYARWRATVLPAGRQNCPTCTPFL